MRARFIGVALIALLLPDHALAAGRAGPGGKAPPKPERPACKRAEFRVVLDVGHSAQSPGAISARGVPEYEFNLGLGKFIEKALLAAGFRRTTLLVTPGPARAGLFARVARANALPADLFISIHHDSVPEWFLEVWEHGGKQNRYSDRFAGHSIFVSFENPQLEASLLFGNLLGKQLRAHGFRYTPHYTLPAMDWRRRQLVDAEAGVYRYDELLVLKDTKMPAVLFEAGSIINRSEELLMGSPTQQSVISAAVAKAVELFCAARAAP